MTSWVAPAGMWDNMIVVFSADNGGPIYGKTGTGGGPCSVSKGWSEGDGGAATGDGGGGGAGQC